LSLDRVKKIFEKSERNYKLELSKIKARRFELKRIQLEAGGGKQEGVQQVV
jgi:hypothetical protein